MPDITENGHNEEDKDGVRTRVNALIEFRPKNGHHYFLLMRRKNGPLDGLWEVPGGGMELSDKGNHMKRAVEEVRQETGLSLLSYNEGGKLHYSKLRVDDFAARSKVGAKDYALNTVVEHFIISDELPEITVNSQEHSEYVWWDISNLRANKDPKLEMLQDTYKSLYERRVATGERQLPLTEEGRRVLMSYVDEISSFD